MKGRLVMLAVMIVMTAVAAASQSLPTRHSMPIPAPTTPSASCSAPADDGSGSRGFCNISFCYSEGWRCVNVPGGGCPGNCIYEGHADTSCVLPDPYPPCYAGGCGIE